MAQIARRISERLLASNRALSEQLNSDVCEAAALAHDLGHPPFGHNGEVILNGLASKNEVGGGYEGNAQSLRILTKLAARSASHAGLDLTVATLRASVKYPWTMDRGDDHGGKYGCYPTEKPILEEIFSGLPFEQPTLEAQIMDWADDIAYSVHDLYDFALAGVIPLRTLKEAEGTDLRSMLLPGGKVGSVPAAAFESVVLALRPMPAPDLGRASRFSSQLVCDLKEWVSERISRFAMHKLRIDAEGSLVKDDGVEDEVRILKALTYHFAIGSPALAVRQHGEATVLRGLFEILLSDLLGGQRLMSDEAKARHESDRPAQAVCDLISSMTDAQAAAMYHKLIGNLPASVLDMTTPSVM